MFSDIEERYFFHNALSFFKKSDITKFPFNENLTGKEDRYWAIDIVKKGNRTFMRQVYQLIIITQKMAIPGRV